MRSRGNSHHDRSADVIPRRPPRQSSAWLSALAISALASSLAHAGPAIKGTLVEDRPDYDAKARLIIRPSDEAGANGYKFKLRIGGIKSLTTGDKIDLSNRALILNLYTRHPSSPGCADYASPIFPPGTGTRGGLSFNAADIKEPPLTPGIQFPEYPAGTPTQICGDVFLNTGGLGPYLGIKVGADPD